MDATQMISDSFLESEDEETEEVSENNRGPPVAKLCILKNQHISEAELPLFVGENILGREPNTCTQVFAAPSVSKQHACISISVYGGRESCKDIEALLWDLGSMNGTRKGHRKLTPNVRYALSEGDSVVVADIPCQYVSSAVDIFSHGDVRTRLSKTSGVNAKLSDTSGRNGNDIGTDSRTCVSGDAKAREPDLENASKTPHKTGCLSFEQTPTQPQGILVPESDLDSDGEIQKVERKRKALISDTNSSFSSPATKIVPESEDESPITPSVSAKNRPNRHVSFSKEESDSDVGRQQLKEKKARTIVDDSEEEERGEKERTTLGGRKSEDSGQHVTVKQGNNGSFTGEDELPVSAPAVVTDGIPAFNMDSDTDVEGEEEVAGPVGAATLNTNEQAAQPPDTAQFHMDSDTDVDEDDNASERASKSVPSSSAAGPKPSHVIPVVQPEGIAMDSDTDVEGEEEVVVPVTLNSTEQTPRPPDTAQFHMDSDTDVDEDDEGLAKVPKSVPSSAADAKPSHSTPAIQPEASTVDSDTDVDEDTAVSDPADPAPLVKPAHFHLDSDTDVEEEEKEAINTSCKTDETPSRLDNKQNEPSSDPATHNLQLGSDTEDEAVVDAVPAISDPSTVPPVTESSTTAKGAPDLDIRSDSDTETEDNCPVVKPHATAELSVTPDTASKAPHSESDADTDVDESSTPPAGDRVNAADPPVDSDANVELKEVDLGLSNEDQIPRLCRESTPGLLVPPLQKCSTPVQLSERGVEDMDTQAFLCPSEPFRCTRSPALKPKASFSLSDGLEDEDCVVAETQSFVLQTRDHTMDTTQAFTTDSSGDEKGERSSRGASFQLGLSDSSHLQAQAQAQAQAVAMESTQAFVSVGGGENLEDADEETDPNLEATQAYGDVSISSATSEKEGQVDLALAATQAYIPESCDNSEDETDEDKTRDISNDETQPLDFPISSTVAMAETQLMSALDEEDEESPEERKDHGEAAQAPEKPVHEALSVAETQPMHVSHDEESNDEDSIPGPRKRKAKRLHLEDEQTQALDDPETSSVETQPMLSAHGEDQDEDLIPGPRRRRGTAHKEEQTQPMASSEVSVAETQPMLPLEDGESDDEDSVPGPRKRRAKAQRIQEEETQSLTNSERETQDLDTKAEAQLQRGRRQQPEAGASGDPGKRRTRTRLREEEEQAESSEPPRRQTRGRNKALPITRGRRGKPLPDEEESEEEEEAAKGKPARGKQTTRQKKKAGEEETFERNKRTAKKQAEGENKEKEEKDRLEREEKERMEREEKERLEREEMEREEKERMEKERLEREEKERLEREEKERMEKERLEREEKDRKEKEEKLKIEKERKEQEEKETARKRELEERLEMERTEREHQARLETEAKEREERERLEREKQQEEENTPKKAPVRGRRAARRTNASPSTTAPEQDSASLTSEDVPARRTRSRSNSSNSISSERSASSINTPKSTGRGRGRGRGSNRTSDTPQAAASRGGSRRKTATAEPEKQDGNENSPQAALSRSNSNNSLNSEFSSYSSSSQGRGRGGRQQGRGRKSEASSLPPSNSQSDSSSTKSAPRGRRSRIAEEPFNDDEKKQTGTTRGQRRATANDPEPAAADEEGPSHQREGCAVDASPLPKRSARGRGQKVAKNEAAEASVTTEDSDRNEAAEKRKGRKRELGENSVSGEAAAAEATGQDTKAEIPPVQTKRGRTSSAQVKKNPNVSSTEVVEKEEDEKKEEVAVKSRGKGRQSAVPKKRKEEEEMKELAEQDACEEASEPQTPTTAASRKRRAPSDSTPLTKSRRASSGPPAASGLVQAVGQIYKVLFTGVVDEAGERVLARLGGSMAKGVADMNCLVTDKVRRTVKFLCALAKGVPIVTTQWLEKSGKAGSLLSPDAFIVKDPEQEQKFSFCLQESLKTASSHPLLQGYAIHVTKSVKPEPVHMKDIISCSGATFLAKMPTSQKPQTVVISCEDDWPLCGPALSASLPVVTAEFILTGILQQKLDFQTYALTAPAATPPLAGGRGRGRKKT
ncbi:uncharacterized protein V6R79_006421 [Siganus canaliculatus]